jgi:hypothetical protein
MRSDLQINALPLMTVSLRKHNLLRTSIALTLSCFLTGCDGVSDDSEIGGGTGGTGDTTSDITGDTTGEPTGVPTGNTTEDIVEIGGIRTIQVNGTVLSSLPQGSVAPPAESVELGRLLFWDPVLSGDQDVACATCHLPEFGYTDGRRHSVGVGGVGAGPNRTPGHTGQVRRNAQSVVNTFWNGISELGVVDQESASMFWDNRTESLESQAREPLLSREEMRGDNFTEAAILNEIEARLNSISEYQVLFEQAYGSSNVSIDNVTQALADFQRTLVANNSPFDQYLRGNTNALSASLSNMIALNATAVRCFQISKSMYWVLQKQTA